MSYTLLKFVLQPVLLEIDMETGEPVREIASPQVVKFTPRQLREYAEGFEAELARFNVEQAAAMVAANRDPHVERVEDVPPSRTRARRNGVKR